MRDAFGVGLDRRLPGGGLLGREELPEPCLELGVKTVDEDDAEDLLGLLPGEELDREPAEARPDEDVRRLLTGGGQERPEPGDDAIGDAARAGRHGRAG